MKSRNVFLGIIILFIGVIALLKSLGIIAFSWGIAASLWPLLLIVIGISILPANDLIKALLLVLTIAAGCLLYHNKAVNHAEDYTFSGYVNRLGRNNGWNDDDDTDDEYVEGGISQQFSEPFDGNSFAKLNLEFGAGKLTMGKPCAELVLIDNESDIAKYDFRVEKNDSLSNVFLSPSNKNINWKSNVKNDLSVSLCPNPVWDFDIETGAADLNFDFSPYQARNIDIQSGVCDMNIKLGDKGNDTNLNIESGVSDIEIDIPSNAGCKIVDESALSGKEFVGFQKTEKGHWQTPNYNAAMHKITINLSCAVSNIDIERY